MRTNPIICVDSHNPSLLDELRSSFLACARTDNIINLPTTQPGHINLENLKISEITLVAHSSRQRHFALVIDEPDKKRYYRLVKRMWRNWQTHRLQVPAGLGPWRFDSSHPHCLASPCRGLFAPTHNLTKGPVQADKYLG
jgi:hypothetical protein